jgi:tetratricopeptide (TPR) repeat protein
MLQAGSGFLSQHSKEVFFGLGETKGPIRASIWWPSGSVQELHDLPINHRIWIAEGAAPSRMEPFRAAPTKDSASVDFRRGGESLPTKVETWLLAPVPAPDFSLPDLSGKIRTLAEFRGKPILLHFWATNAPGSQPDLATIEKHFSRWSAKGLQVLSINVDSSTSDPKKSGSSLGESRNALAHRFSFPILRGSEDVAAIYNILYRQVFDRHRDLNLPTSFLIDGEGSIVKVYQGAVAAEHVEEDFLHIPRSSAERLARALPFPSPNYSLEFGRNHLSAGSVFYQRGYLEQAEVSFQQALQDDPTNAEAVYGIGSVYLNQNRNADARRMFERCLKLRPNYPDTLPDAWNNLGVLATRENRIADSVEDFQQALKLNPHHLLSLDNLGNAYRVQKRWDDARNVLERALEVAPEDPEANYSLGMVFAQTNDTPKAEDYLHRALKARPVYPEALNNLGVLYLVTHRRDDAVASFQQCIRVAPAFDQAYLNLARVYALEGVPDKARGVLLDLLKQHPDHPQAKQMLERLQQ